MRDKMNNTLKVSLIALAIGASGGFLQMATAQGPSTTRETSGNTIHSDVSRMNEQRSAIDAEDFVETASAKGIAEINAAQLALEDGTSQVHGFANTLIADHTEANRELEQIARRNNLEVADNATLMDRARAMMLSVRDGESFDEAFIENQINAHEESIELFERAAHSANSDIQAFAAQKLPKLHEHLQMAQQLQRQMRERS